VQYSGSRLSMPCVAYGSPRPEIFWSSPSEGISNFQNEDSPSVNIYTTNITDPTTGAPLLLSILELCDTNYNTSLLTIQCRAVNSLSGGGLPALGVDVHTFELSPISKLMYSCVYPWMQYIRNYYTCIHACSIVLCVCAP